MEKKTSAPDLKLVEQLLRLVGDADGDVDADSVAPPTLYVPQRRLLQKTPSDVSVDSNGFPKMLEDQSLEWASWSAKTKKPQPVARAQKRKMSEEDAEAFKFSVDEDFDHLMLENIQNMLDMAEMEAEEAASFAASQAQPKAQGSAGEPAARPKAKSSPKAKVQPKAQSRAQEHLVLDDKFAVGYNAMTYPAGACALRETTGEKRQLFQIRSAEKTKDALWVILKEASRKLAAGEAKEDVKSWAQNKAAQ